MVKNISVSMISRIRYENQSRLRLTHKESRQSKGVLRLKVKKLAYWRAIQHPLDVFIAESRYKAFVFLDFIKEV